MCVCLLFPLCDNSRQTRDTAEQTPPRGVDRDGADGALLIGPPRVVLVLQPVQPLHEPLVGDKVVLEGGRRRSNRNNQK